MLQKGVHTYLRIPFSAKKIVGFCNYYQTSTLKIALLHCYGEAQSL